MKVTAKVPRAKDLDRDRIVDTALALVRREGIASLTMANVAKHLGTKAGSLYYHVSNRDDMIRGLVDRVADAAPHPPANLEPVEEIEAIFVVLYEGMLRDTWIVPHLIENYPSTENILSLMRRVLEALEAMGLPKAGAWHAYHAMLHYTFGEVTALDSMDQRARHRLPPGYESSENFRAIGAFSTAGEECNDMIGHYRANLRRTLRAIALEKTETQDENGRIAKT